jgi:hypothetical protein
MMSCESDIGKSFILTEAECLTREEVLALYGIAESTLKKYTKLNKIPHVKITRKTMLFPKQAILKHLEQNLSGMGTTQTIEPPQPIPNNQKEQVIGVDPANNITNNKTSVKRGRRTQEDASIFTSILEKVKREASVIKNK